MSIKMAKEQGLSLNPTKISGSCGRLMCCLQYEQSVYEELNKLTPKNGTQVTTPEGRGTVVDSNVLTGKIKVRLDREPEFPVVEVLREDLNKPARTEPAAPVQEPVAPAPAPIEEAPVQPPKAEKPHREAAKQNRPQGNKPAGEKPAGKPHHRPRHHRHRHKQQG